MSSCCEVCDGSGCGCCKPEFTDPTKIDLAHTLAGSLIPCVDQIRDLYTCLGTRGYAVALVRTRWSGGERGIGVEELLSEELLLPTPRIKGLDAIDRVNEVVGILERGSLKVDQISARYTEDQLLGFGTGGTRIPDDQQFYWEVRTLGAAQVRRRFIPRATPSIDMMNLQWTVNLDKANADRGRAGDLR